MNVTRFGLQQLACVDNKRGKRNALIKSVFDREGDLKIYRIEREVLHFQSWQGSSHCMITSHFETTLNI